MINKKALINQHIYEIEKLRHDLIVTQTKNGLYLSEDRQTEIRHKSENKSGNLVDSRRKIESRFPLPPGPCSLPFIGHKFGP
ncbi:hypothetical protein BY996DRAFT_6504413 [Phakopsora pachyrhizi]|nr:hypothetical protein BY996DRAFT_6504413 [Phakopsora pachyrhizi]